METPAFNRGPREERGTLNPPSKPPLKSWWATASREDWNDTVAEESKRMRGSKEEADYVHRIT